MLTKPNRPVAIIGIAAALPGGAGGDPDRFADMLERRVDAVAPVPPERLRDGGRDPGAAFAECALLDRIDAFDPKFFGMSMREARQMDPQQRFLLMLACESIWNAGRSLADLRGSRTAVVLGEAAEDYSPLLAGEEVPLVSGYLAAAQAGRVAYALDLHGPALCLNTACSSSLAAILSAVRMLQRDEADLALTGGIRLFPRPPFAVVPGNEGILSPGGRARSFDAQADGTGLGEGGALFLLKPLAAAQADGDPIHAVILGGATNQDGGRSNGFASPSQTAQADLLRAAWTDAGVKPASIGMIEAHGTGTRLGDPIEFQALDDAFGREDRRGGFCVLSSLKSNIGHLDSAAGAAGMLKLVLALQRGRRYASAHFTAPNPHLPVEGSALVLSPETQAWPSAGPRRGGVSAFGITGTNVHLVLEEAPAEPPPHASSSPLLVPLSATSRDALRRHAATLAGHLAAGKVSLADLACVQAVGRDHETWRAAIVADDADDAVAALRGIADGDGLSEIGSERAVTFLLPHEGEIDADLTAAWLAAFPGIGPAIGNDGPHAGKLAVMRALTAAGLVGRSRIGHGSGNAVLDALDTGTVAAAVMQPAPIDPARLGAALDGLSVQGPFVVATPWDGTLAAQVAGMLAGRNGDLLRLDAGAEPRRALLEFAAALYRAGAAIPFATFVVFVGGYGRRVPIPADLFDPVRCWVETLPKPAVATTTATAAAAAIPAEADGDVESVLAAIWRSLLEADAIGPEDDFFDLGGDSLMQVQLQNAVRDRLGYELDFSDVYDHPTLAALAAFIVAERGRTAGATLCLKEADGTETERGLAEIWSRLLGTDAVSRLDDFFDLGGDSLMHVQLENAVRERFGVGLSMEDVYDDPTLTAVAARIAAAAIAAARPAAPAGGSEGPEALPGRDRAPATNSQRRMWLLQEMAPASGAYNVTATFSLSARVDPVRLANAMERLVRRHAILRSRFALEDGRLMLYAMPGVDMAARLETHGMVPAGHDASILAAHAARPFDLAAAGAWRALLIEDAGDGTGRFQFVLHHAICDEWSLELLLREIAADYAGEPVAAPPMQFLDWAAFEAETGGDGRLARDRAFWTATLAGAPLELPLPTDFPGTGRLDHDGAWLRLAVPAEKVTAMRAAARREGGTLFAWLMTGYAAFVSRVSQASDIVIGVPVAGRHHAAAERIPGCFINTLPLRLDTSGTSFRTLFARVRAGLSDAMAHARYPFDRMVEELGASGEAGRPPLVQTLLSLQGGGPAGRIPFRLGEAAATPILQQTPVSWLDLSAVLWECADGGLEGILAFRTALFEEATVRSFQRDWTELLDAGLTHPDEPIETLLQEEAW
ncbi:polyketide synthase (plasmid) [Azospirillum sp. B510]|uniref:condensation domain-containing protein n=1 Tax=Azospirillum sp. (strain B510) TaxID=137722 RepID=UPI0001C4B851|nr:condensation domain-containing protein [Azospirillum sp. B510]BAI74126.1 polyketide synthase [Azospirillum sp. B510]